MTGFQGFEVAGRYRLIELIGQGAMGRVWRGHDRKLDREVAVKEVILSRIDPSGRGREVERVIREARAAARMQHPGIVTVYDVVEHDGAPWIVMELIAGSSLAVLIADHGPLAWQTAAKFGEQVADALAHAHAAGVVHSDVKPANILLAGERAVLGDFGIARILEETVGLGSADQAVGTLPFMAPEQARGHPVQASDLWSLGATLYSAVEGRFLYTGSPTEILADLLDPGRPVPAPRHAGPLADVLSVLLDKEAARRPAAAAVARRLHEIRTLPPVPPTTTTAPPGPPPDPPRLPPYYHHLTVPGPPIPGRGFADATAGSVKALAYSPDGAVLATGGSSLLGAQPTVRLWNPRTQRLLRRPLKSGSSNSGVSAVAFSPDGTLLVAGGTDGTVRSWDVRTRRPLGVFTAIGRAPWDPGPRRPGETADVRGWIRGVFDRRVQVAFSPDGTILATGGSADSVCLWEPRTGRALGEPLPGHTSGVAALAFSPTVRCLAAGGLDGTVRLWDPWTGRSVGEPLAGNHEQILATAFSPDGALLAFGGTGDGVRLWDPRTRRFVGEPLTGYSGDVAALAFSPDGFLLATAGSGRTVWLWDVRTRQPLCRRLVGHAGTIRELAFSPDGTVLAGVSADKGVLAAASGNAAVWLWDVRNDVRNTAS